MATGIAPIEVGTRGTVASLVKKEIEYFHRLEIDRPSCSRDPQERTVDEESSASRSSNRSWHGFGFLTMTWRKKKKRRVSGSFLPNMCSMVEISDVRPLNGVSGFSYRNLKADFEEL